MWILSSSLSILPFPESSQISLSSPSLILFTCLVQINSALFSFRNEIESLSGAHFELISDYYKITPQGNWEGGRNILHYRKSDDDFTARHKISLDEWERIKSNFAEACMELRANRIRPGLDDKIISGWNGLMLKGLVDKTSLSARSGHSFHSLLEYAS